MIRYCRLTAIVCLIFIFSFSCTTRSVRYDLDPVVKERLTKDKEQQSKELSEEPRKKEETQQNDIEEVRAPAYGKTGVQRLAYELEVVDADKLHVKNENLKINVDGMPINDFVVYAVGEVLGVSFYMDEAVKTDARPVTLRMTREMPAQRVLEIVVELLRQHSLLVGEKAGSLYVLRPTSEDLPSEVRMGRTVPVSPSKIVQVVTLRYLNVNEISALIGEIYKTGDGARAATQSGVSVRVFPRDNALILTGAASSMKDILTFIDTMDIPYLQKKKLFLMKLTYWHPDEFITQLKEIFAGMGLPIATSYKEPGVQFISIKFLNSVLVVSPDDEMVRVVSSWKDRMDTPESAGSEEKTFIYTPKYSRASDLVSSLEKIYGAVKQKTEKKTVPPTTTPSQTQSTTPATTTPSTFTVPEKKEAVSADITITADNIRIASDDRRNLIILMTTASIYKSILQLLVEMDKPPRQVLLEATVAEMTIDDQTNLGFEWYLSSRMFDGTYAATTSGKLGIDSKTGFVFQYVADNSNVQNIVNMLASDKKIEILSKPHMMVLDNQEATIQIGNDVPIISSEVSAGDVSTSTTNPSVLRNVQYRSTGMLMKIKPTINADGLVTLDISQEVSEAQTNKTSNIDSPLILKRKIATSVVSADGQTIVLGGIRSNNMDKSDNKIPILGDIPIIGYAFKNESSRVRKTELIILITPRIVTSIDETGSVTKQLIDGFMKSE